MSGYWDAVRGRRNRPGSESWLSTLSTSGRRTIVWVAVAWTVGIVLTDLPLPDLPLVVLYGLAPLVACSALPPRPTALFAGVAVGGAAVSRLWTTTTTPVYLVRVVDVVLVSAAAVAISAVRTEREARLSRVTEVAAAAQRAMLPRVPALAGGLRMGARYHSAAEESLIGGDLYDVVHDGPLVRAIVGDVCGKGLDGVQHAARVIRAFRQYASRDEDLPTLAGHLDQYMTPFLGPEMFVTAVLLEVDGTDSFRVVSCGHPAPLLMSAGGMTELQVAPGPPLGIGPAGSATEHMWCPGDRLLLYSDGLIEARDGDGGFLPSSALAGCLAKETVDACLDSLIDTVAGHVRRGELLDDLVLLLLERTGAATGSHGQA